MRIAEFREGPFTVTSYGGGWGYTVRGFGRSFWIQDESADIFREEALNAANPEERIADYMDAIGEPD